MFLRLYALKESPLEIRTRCRTWLCDSNLPSISLFDVVKQKLMLLEIIYAFFPSYFSWTTRKISPYVQNIAVFSHVLCLEKTLSKWHS
jgi:hypothetical protein